MTFLRLLVLAAVTLSGVFGEAGARTVSLETDTFVVEGMYREHYPAYQPGDGGKYYPLGWQTWGWEVVVDEDS